MKNDFLVFGGDGAANVIDQDTYAGLTERFTGFQAGVAQSAELNKVWRQSSIMAAVLAQFIVDLTGRDVIDDGTVPTVLADLKAAISAQSVGVVGMARNVRMNVIAPSATAALLADEIIVVTALGGRAYRLGAFDQGIDLSKTGIAGMDTGTPPINGWVAVYAIHNPTTGARGLLGVDATSTIVPEVYGGANMPAGFTASALVSVRRTNGTGQFAIGYQQDREINIAGGLALNGGTATTYTSVSLAGLVPPNAKRLLSNGSANPGFGQNGFRMIAADSATEIAIRPLASPIAGATAAATLGEMMIVSPQTVYYKNDVGSSLAHIYVTGYKI